jgi:hypothetical protein
MSAIVWSTASGFEETPSPQPMRSSGPFGRTTLPNGSSRKPATGSARSCSIAVHESGVGRSSYWLKRQQMVTSRRQLLCSRRSKANAVAMSATVAEAAVAMSGAKRGVLFTVAGIGIGHSLVCRIAVRSNKGMKQTKPSVLELRSLSPVFGGPAECDG